MDGEPSDTEENVVSDLAITLPGKVQRHGEHDVNSTDIRPKPTTSPMNKVSPEQAESTDIYKTKMADESERLTTSFTTTGYDNYNAAITNENQPNRPLGEQTRIDSIQKPYDARLENLDLSELSLHQIARDGNVFMMKAALKQFSRSRAARKLNKRDNDKFTPLHYAARYNHFEMCQLLLQHGANLHSPGEDSLTALHLVAKYKPKKEKTFGAGDGDKSDTSIEEDVAAQQEANVRVLEFLISSGARVNDRDFYGLAPLHHASLRGNKACVDKLLQCRGINIEARDKQDMTPLHMCAVYGNVHIAKTLIASGADIRCKDNDDGTPLQFAAAEGNLEIVNLLFDECEKRPQLDVKDMLEEKDNDGNTPLHLAVDNGQLDVAKFIIDQCLLIGQTAFLNARRGNRETPLHIAAKHGHLDIVKLLVDKSAKINSRNDSLQTPLFLASQFNHHQVVKFLIECGANIELRDADNYTPLLIAASYGHTETIAVLLQNKANILAVDKNDKTVLYMCAEEDRVDALQEFLKRNRAKSLLEVTDRYNNAPLHIAAENGHLSIVKILLDAGAIIDSKNEDEQTALHLAAENGSVKIVKELVGRKKEIVHDDDENANTPLHLAALAGREHVIRELVRLGANIGARNAKQWTPLDCCASAGMHKSARVLLEADSPVDPKDKRKITPLHLACQEGHRRMVDLLLEWGADVTHRSVSGNNALDFAVDARQPDCALAIIESEKWREALQNRTYDFLTEQIVDTPMRKIIRKMPAVASEVFRRCLRDNGKEIDDPAYQISFDYEFLDDEYSCAHWMEIEDNTSEINIPLQESPSNLQGGEVYDEFGKVLPDAVPYTKDSSLLTVNHPLYVMVKSKRVDLMRHPLVISLLNHKWKSYGRSFYYINLIIYALFMAVFNSYMLTVPPPYAINQTLTIPNTCVRVVTAAEKIWGSGCTPRYQQWQYPASIIILALSAFNLVKEIYQILRKGLSYLKSVTNLIEISLYVLAILTVIDLSEYAKGTGIREAWQWQCGSAALFFSWMGLLLFIQKFPKFGIFVLMFADVFRTFITFFVVFVLFILGFAFSFHVLLQNQFAFDQWWNSIVKTFVMMIGEFEYEGIFNAEFEAPDDYNSQLFYEAITYILFVVFVIIMSIIIMNLLVGLAVDDIKEVQDNAVLESLAMQVKLTLDIEYTLPQWLRRRYMKKYRRMTPNKYRKSNPIVRWLLDEELINNDSIREALNPEKTELQAMEEKLDGLQSKVRDLKSQLYGLSDRSRQVENITQAIANHFKIKWEESEDDEEAG